MYFIAFFEQELRQVRAILAGNSGDQCAFRHSSTLPFVCKLAEFAQIFPHQGANASDLILFECVVLP
jgi:hypothetical protein